MLKYEEIREKYPFFRKGLNDFEAEWITCGCIYKVRKREWKDYCDFVDIEFQKLISQSLYPSLARMLQMYPASHSYFMSINKPTVALKIFLEILWTNSVQDRGSQPFSYHVALQHSDKWACTPTPFHQISMQAYLFRILNDEYVPLKFLITKYFVVIIRRYI